MGLDYIRSKKNIFDKMWRDGRDRLGATDLLTMPPEWQERLLLVDVLDDVELAVGESLLLCLDDEQIDVVRGTEIVGTIVDAPDGLLEVLRKRCHGVTAVRVRGTNAISHTAEVAVTFAEGDAH